MSKKKFVVQRYLMVCQEVTVYADSPFNAVDVAIETDYWLNTEEQIDEAEHYEVFDGEDNLLCVINTRS